MTAQTATQPATMTVRIPMQLERRGGRKVIIAPEGTAPAPQPKRDERLIQAIVKAHRWRRRIESGKAKSITDLAAQEGVSDAYVCRILNLTCLAPKLVEAILDGTQPAGLTAVSLLFFASTAWSAQRAAFGFALPSGPCIFTELGPTRSVLIHQRGVLWCRHSGGRVGMLRRKGDRQTSKSEGGASIRASISFPPNIYEMLERLAKQKKVSLAWVVRDAAERYVSEHKERLDHDGD